MILLRQVPIESKRVADLAVAGDEVRAILREKVAMLELIGDAQPVEEIVVVRQKRFADLKPRKLLALQQQH